MALTEDESRLIAQLTAGAAETPARFRRQGTIVFVGALVVAAVGAAREMWPLVPICVLGGALLYWLGTVAARKNGSERSEPVLRALREAPERIQAIAHTETSDTLRLFVSHWVVVTTADGHLRVRAHDWEWMLGALARRCPGAKLTAR